MNDTSEVQLGVKNLLEAVRKHNTDDREYKDFLVSGIEGYKEETLEVYILSLSAAPDSLYQWCAYARRGGVAIGFDSEKLHKGFLCDISRKVGGQQLENPLRPDPANRLMRCLYTPKKGHLDLRSVVAQRFFKPSSFPKMYASAQSDAAKFFWFRLLLSAEIYRTTCSIKHGAYAIEKEWRCVNYRPDPRDYPVNLNETNRNRWYIEMQFDPKEFIKEVWISPHGDRDAYKSAVAYFKQEHDLPFSIKNSEIPFRGYGN